MHSSFTKVKHYLSDLQYAIDYENKEDGILVVSYEANGITKLVIGCADPILIMEQFICEIKQESIEVYKILLQKNRDIIHGAFVLDQTGRRLIFRNTLELENLDVNELEATFNSLGLLLSEFSEQIIRISRADL